VIAAAAGAVAPAAIAAADAGGPRPVVVGHTSATDAATEASASITGTFESSEGGEGDAPEVFLYPARPTSSIPAAAQAYPSVYFDFSVAPGDYELRFQDPGTGAWVPASAPGVGDAQCSATVTLTAGHELDLGRIDTGDPASANCAPPWSGGGTYSGRVTHLPAERGEYERAVLWFSPDGKTAVQVASAPLGADGSFTLPGVTEAGRYFAQVNVETDRGVISTWEGDLPEHRVGDTADPFPPGAIENGAVLERGASAADRDIALTPPTSSPHTPRTVKLVIVGGLCVIAIVLVVVIALTLRGRRGARAAAGRASRLAE
jgi:hypothetical protein